MALTFNGSTSCLTRTGSALITTYPFTFFAWVKISSYKNSFAVDMATEPMPTLHQGHGLQQNGSTLIQAISTSSGNGGATAATARQVPPLNTWIPCMAVFASSNRRTIYWGSASAVTDTTYVPQDPSLMTKLVVGRQASSVNYFWAGELAGVAIWNAQLTPADFATLSTGVPPSTVQNATLVDYWSLSTQAATQTGIRGFTLTATGTAQAATHPINDGSVDSTSPTLSGSITVSNVSGTGYTLVWPAGSDNVAVASYERSLDGGSTWADVGNVLTVAITGRTPASTDAVRVRARDAAGNASAPLSASVTLLTAADTTAPVLTGVITVTSITTTSYTLAWPVASDNVAVASYERSLDGGSTWANVGLALTVPITGRTPGATDQVRVRAKDAAGNTSTPPLSTSVTLQSAGGLATLSTPPMKNNAGTLLANLSGITVNVYNSSTGALVSQKTGLTSNAAGVVSFSDSALVSGTVYAYEVVTPSNGRRLPTGTAA